jgi:hypothetical protein
MLGVNRIEAVRLSMFGLIYLGGIGRIRNDMKSRSNLSPGRWSLFPGRDTMILARSNVITIERVLFHLLKPSDIRHEICFQ